MVRLSLIVVFLATIVAVQFVYASPISVPLDHWSYHFIERLQAKGVLRDFLSNIKPYSRGEIVDMIAHIDGLMENGEVNLSNVEKDQLELMKGEFAQELIKREIVAETEYRHIVDWSNVENRVVAEIGYAQGVAAKSGTEDHEAYLNTFRVLFWGNLSQELFFYNDSMASYERTDEPLPLWHPYIDDSRYPWSAVSDAYVVVRLPWADLQMGKDAVLWGPGEDGVIGLSGVDPTFDLVKLQIQMWEFKFVNILGFLRDDLAREYRSDVVRKYVSAHRIEIKPFSGFSIGWQEVYIYAENLHMELLNPIMPYQMAEDYLGDSGNNTMEGDIDLCVLPNTRLYASLFLDDLHPKESFFKYNGNRWAILGGVLVVDPFGLENFDFRVEYARVEPWVYPHKAIIQNPPIPLSYKHFNTPLGHWIGPNSDDLFFEANHSFSRDTAANLSYRRVRKGEIGGSLYDYDPKALHANSIANGYEKRFLMGIVEKTEIISLGLTYRIFQDSTLEIGYSHIKIHNKQTEEAKLPSADKRKQPWEAGRDWTQNVFQVTLSLRY